VVQTSFKSLSSQQAAPRHATDKAPWICCQALQVQSLELQARIAYLAIRHPLCLRSKRHKVKKSYGRDGSKNRERSSSSNEVLEMSQTKDNQANIAKNRAKLFTLESTVMWNKALAYRERAMIEENRSAVLQNYSAAFIGNRQIANQNTDDIFRNRRAIFENMIVEGPVQENFKSSMLNQAKVDFLDHRSQLNARVIAVSEKMAEINRMLIAVNNMIMEGNAEIVEFNSANIEINRQYLDGELHPGRATPETNAERIASNTARIAAIQKRATASRAKIAAVMEKVEGNRATIQKDQAEIYARREKMVDNHEKVAVNQERIAALIASGWLPW
jgi:hypothetical protein